VRGVLLGTLGPEKPTLASVIRGLGVEGPVALVTAGWQEYEGQVEELPAQLGRDIVPLELYRRAERVFAEDAELAAEHRALQERLRTGQEYYRMRLARMVDAALDIGRRAAGSALEEDESRLSMEYLRTIDRDHLSRVAAQRAAFELRLDPLHRDAVAQQRKDIQRLLAGTGIVAIAGGHVAVLLNRLRLFGLDELLEDKVVVAWGGGAMVTSERVMLFHESPPQGEGISELLEPGLAFHRGILPMPSPRHRLRLGEAWRVAWMARRHAPFKLIALDNNAHVSFDGMRFYDDSHGSHWMREDGSVSEDWVS
jgi:hypothetical protein